MNGKKILKGIALINFIGLLTLFLLFRNGSFDSYFKSNSKNNLTSPNGGTPTKVLKDTLAQKKEALQLQRLSSSKSIVIIDNLKLNKDTAKVNKDSLKTSSTDKEKSLMYSTKLGIIFDAKTFKTDSLKLQTNKTKKKKKK